MRQFIADAGHELRTPLTIVMGYLEMLQQGVVGDPAGVARVYETMLAESRRMRASIDKLILLARLERPSRDRARSASTSAALARASPTRWSRWPEPDESSYGSRTPPRSIEADEASSTKRSRTSSKTRSDTPRIRRSPSTSARRRGPSRFA